MQNGEKSMHQKAAEGPRRAENGAIAMCAPAGGGKSRPNLAARRSNPGPAGQNMLYCIRLLVKEAGGRLRPKVAPARRMPGAARNTKK